MKTQFLFPRSFKIIGGFLFVIGFVMAGFMFFSGTSTDQFLNTTVFAISDSGIFNEPPVFFGFTKNSLYDELAVTLLIVGGSFMAFARLKTEDEFIAQIRYESLIWAVYFNLAIMLLCTAFIYGTHYFIIMGINIFSLLVFFLIRFHIKLYQLQKSMRDDE